MQAPTSETLREKLSRVNNELRAAGRVDNFYLSLEGSWNRYGSLTPNQEAALVRSFARMDERAAARATENAAVTAPMPTGRVTISGEILSTKWQDSRFGGAWKMLVKSEAGWKVWGTIPAGIESADNGSVRFEELGGKGYRVTFTAKIESKEPSFGFFSRPTNARLVAPPATANAVTEGQSAPIVPAAPVAAPARPALSDIIAKAKELEQQNRQDQIHRMARWDTDAMVA